MSRPLLRAFRPLICSPFRRRYSAQTSTASNAPQTIFSGIQPTGIPHLGNYLGALRQWVTAQNTHPASTQLFYCLVDLHAITRPQDPMQLKAWRRESLATLLAIGIDVERCVVFEQSMVPEHVELMWILSCIAPMGALRRMTQWKSKLNLAQDAKETEDAATAALKLGLFAYPVLQAADILIYRATHVPVGEDQAQHLELTRQIANSFNVTYGNVFPLPETVLSEAKRVMSLREPKTKMSKSAKDEGSRIILTDENDVIRARFRKAVTDSLTDLGVTYDPENRPGVSNLVDIAAHIRGVGPEVIVEDAKGLSMKAFKEMVADEVVKVVEPIREEYKRINSRDDGFLDEIAAEGARQASASARETMRQVRDAIGIANR